MGKLVSIIVPVYNIADYLDKMVISILSQSYQDIEILLVNDGSTDESLIMCQKYEFQDNRVKVFNQMNSGVSVARNRGIEESTGDFLFFFDGDDYVESTMIEVMVNKIEPSIDMVVCGITIHNHYLTNKQFNKGISEKEKKITIKELAYDYWEYYELGVINAPWNKLFRKEIIDYNQLKFPEGLKMGEDAYFNLSYLSHSKEIKIISNPMYHYFIYSGQSSKRINIDHYQMMAFNFEKIRSFIQQFDGFKNKKIQTEFNYQFYREVLYSMKLIYRSKMYSKNEKKQYIHKIVEINKDIQYAEPKRIEDYILLPLFKKKSISSIHLIIQNSEKFKMTVKKILLK